MATSNTPFPVSVPPDATGDELAFEEERPSVSELRTALPTVALLVDDPELRSQLAELLHGAGMLTADEDILPTAAAVITDAKNGVEKTVTSLRARARSDAAIIAVLHHLAPESAMHVAYQVGALLCVRQPIDEDQLLAALRSPIDLHSAKMRVGDLMRQLDEQSHLAALGRVTANFTHELSNPLAVLSINFGTLKEQTESLGRLRDLMARALREGFGRDTVEAARPLLSATAPAEEFRAALCDIGDAIGRINGILETVRSLTRGSLSSRIEEVDLVSIVREVRRWAAGELEGVDVQELIDEPIVARADPRLLGQIVLNLVTNAAHAARQLPSPRVRMHVYGSEDTAIVSVRDNGPGVPAEIRDRIFEPFFTTRRGQGGTGLGLALCREYASQMQAHLTLWTAPGRGACFRIHLRRA
jgi:signal transduction histidine kinase